MDESNVDMPPHARGARLLMQHRTALYAYILACVRDRDTAEDLLQDVSVTVLQSINDLRTADGFMRWSREIARRRVLGWFRSNRRERPIDPDVFSNLADAAERRERTRPTNSHRQALLNCLDALPGNSRDMLIERYAPGFNIEKLAKRLNRSVQGVYALIKRTKLSLRRCVEQRLMQESV